MACLWMFLHKCHRDQKALSESRKNLQNVEADLYEKSKLLEKVQNKTRNGRAFGFSDN